ncbi:MAG TPA: TrkA family potassium uptake protein [Acidimicrobiales bacterium]|nr:TrkA family potassium uptake protein [Acidimicrobiales bacterium]
MKVVIVGAGNVGTFIATDLQSGGHDVTLMEKDHGVATRLVSEEHVEGLHVLEADACEVTNLQKAGLAEADVVVAATGDDEDNLVVSLLSKQEFAVPRVVARVNHPKNHWLFNESWGVDVAVSTPHLLTGVVEEAVTTGALVRLLQLERGEANLVEVTLAQDSPAAGRSIAELQMPRDATVVAVIRSGHVVVPRGDTGLTAGDEVLCLVTPRSVETVRALLVAG